MAAWFGALDFCAIRPALEVAEFVIIDGWYYKFVARFLRKPFFTRDEALAPFASLSPPDSVIWLDIDPAVAATRRERILSTEAGMLDGFAETRNRAAFTRYQQITREELARFAEQDTSWSRVMIADDASPTDVADVVLRQLSNVEISRT
jgi:thymidylate kinase